jgi:hypothetical protein
MSAGAQSSAVDLDEVNARLTMRRTPSPPGRCTFLSPGRTAAPTASDLPPSTPPEVRERERYSELVQQGGRPMYLVEFIDDATKDPTAFNIYATL